MQRDQPSVATLKLQDCARAIGVPSRDFRALCAKFGVPVLRPSERRERICREHFDAIVTRIAGPALDERRVA